MSYDSTLVGVGIVIVVALLAVLFKRIKKYKHEQALFRQSQMGYPNPPPLRSPIPNEPYPILHLPNYANSGSMRDTVITIDGNLQRQYEFYENIPVPHQVFSPRHYEPPPPYPGESNKSTNI
ncbi:hypothetical protein V3C99_016829 [Haemonchus contortus]|uniref:Secreted protein n=2 Tax=Haemonchus TaxID=6288 RepID=A0A158QKZ7_HAEPC|nr:unnamed protein product [Haemonchus contortus]VDO26287.1 unnamed protein product [Haemonchus placei]